MREAAPLLDLPTTTLSDKNSFPDVFDLYVNRKGLSFADCYHANLTRRLNLPAIISFDRGFDRVPNIRRIEP